jgi:dihydrodipicolinate synthase/N-acetylneuraminate lyase
MVRWLRATYPDLPMAGIVPRDALAWWRIFPYKAIRASTDVMMPMCYTSRYLTAAQTRRMAANCVTTIHRETGDPKVPVHVIAGVTDFLTTRQLVAAARGAKAAGSDGFSLYNLETTAPSDWRAIELWRS